MTARRPSGLLARYVAAVGLMVFALFALLAHTDYWQRLEFKGFDVLSVETAPMASKFPVTLVGIDENSFAEIGRQWPWPRGLHAKLLDQLARGGAMVVVFDVLLSEASVEAEDQALAAAIARHGGVVLVSDKVYQETAYAKLWSRVDPLEAFRKAGAANGLATVQPESGDQVVRRLPDGDDVLWREVIRKVNKLQPGMLAEPNPPPGSYIRYAGPYRTFPYVSYYQALEADKMLPANAFADQIVIVGRDLKASIDAGFTQADMFATPFAERTGLLTPGVELHANILETVLRNDPIKPAPAWAPTALLALVVVLCAVLMARWRPLLSLAIALGLIGLVAALAWVLFAKQLTWLPVLGSMAAITTMYVALGGLGFFTEQHRKNEVRRAFSLYVSPDVVDQMLANPEKLKLGGERREVTVLFTDLKGFTTLSEALGAVQVTELITEHFTRASAIAKRNGGTVTQFIGDAVMAIWNAPLDVANHAARAGQAAREMQADIAAMRADLVARGLPEIHMRIGLNTCVAVVGNLGAADRFNYTALGDGVNLSSRLEGVNKLFGTGILMSGETARAQEPGAPLRQVGRVVVKGKSEPVDIFTFDDDAKIRELTDAAFLLYRARDWDGAEAQWRAILALREGDGVARHYLDMIAAFRTDPPADGWDSSESLDKM
ncbi:CHASE2 domain-containing protein [Usitatibacter palustris]|uniref:Guanylate cyclase domain-containing protein n=1 Tax=Usitatibacter palustris TaxID=2732487 RepID=A0A6M4H430_9PROT|nr:adenylate/guanylate cyclase domain-containing protein [Usitatibacter palustris]QJR14341.1 hypothetical protein DSM104440_01137 [Usitatibacter palustris]